MTGEDYFRTEPSGLAWGCLFCSVAWLVLAVAVGLALLLGVGR